MSTETRIPDTNPFTGWSARSLARAATRIENRTAEAKAILRDAFRWSGRAAIYGITGPPGAGKSSLVDRLILEFRQSGRRVGVLAVDPSSPFHGGALLGDRIRMQRHHTDPGVFIRSMATRGVLGGVARATSDLSLFLDAAGFEAILIETVGVGQDEVEIAQIADVTAVVLVPGMGDDVQALKAGIMEIADIFLLNKSDQPGADRLELELKQALSLAHPREGWTPPIVRTVATDGTGIAAAVEALEQARSALNTADRKKGRWLLRLRNALVERTIAQVSPAEWDAGAEDAATGRRDPQEIIEQWICRR